MQWQVVHTPQTVQKNDDYKILWNINIQIDKSYRAQATGPSLYQQSKTVSNYWLRYTWWPEHSHQRTGKKWQVPGLKNGTTQNMECQGSGHTVSYRCPRNYVKENT